MPPMLKSIPSLVLLASLCHANSFHNKIHGLKGAHDTLAENNRLQQLADLAQSSSATISATAASASSLAQSSALLSSTSVAISFSSLNPSSTTSAAVTLGTLAAADTTFQIYTADTLPSSPAPPSACANALTASVACNSTIQLMGANPYYDATSLALMCTSTCTSSLKSYRSSVVSSCGSYMIPGPNNVSYAPTLAVDTVSGPYSVECEQDLTTGTYCNQVLQTYGPVPAQGVLGYPTSELCSSCVLGTLNATLSNPLTFDPTVYAELQSALLTCGSSYYQYNVTRPPTTTSIYTPGPSTTPVGANVTTSSSCALIGRNITTSGNSTCAGIASQYSVTWYDASILANNPTMQAANCTSGIAGGTPLCLPQACTTYTPVANQTCADVVSAANGIQQEAITVAQLISFNPNLGAGCTQMGRQYGLALCISPHGGFPDVGTSNPDNPTPSSTPTAIVAPPGETAPGTTSNCGAWYYVQPNDYCTKVVLNNSITLDDFLLLNPEVNANCTNLWASYYYCVAAYPPLASATGVTTSVAPTGVFTLATMTLGTATAPTPFNYPTGSVNPPANVAAGTILDGCDWYYDVQTGDNCTSIEQSYNISDADFTLWNQDCPDLTVGSAVCVLVLNATAALPPTPTNAASGSAPSGCAKWYTIVQNDNCPSVEAKFGLTQAQFYALNPELAPDSCSNLDLGEAYCVEAPPTSTTTTTSGPTGPTAPSNLNPGSWSNCSTYYTVVSGDTCDKIEDQYNIAFTDFLLWNPEVSTTCSNLNLAAYCVQGSGGCSKIYTVVSGDYCSLIESKVNLTDAALRSLNSWMDANCDLEVGQNLCIAAPTSTGGGTTTTTTTTTSASPTPTNIESGSWTNCTTYYNVKSGDTCNVIEAQYSISFTDFLRWNPEVSTTCGNLDLASYCVAGTGACSKLYTVVSGDYCSEIETAQGITDAQLRSLNPWLDTNCDLQVGQNLCV